MREELYYRILEPVFLSLSTLLDKTLGFLPNLFAALLLLIFGTIISKLVAKGLVKLLDMMVTNKLSAKTGIKDIIEKTGYSHNVSLIIGKLIYWVIFLMFLIIALETLELRTVSASITSLFHFLPQVIAAILIIMVGLVISRLASDAVKKLAESAKFSYANMLGTISYFVMMVFMTLIAINEIGIDTSVISNNITVFIMGITLAGALAIGIGGKRIAENLLASPYVRKNYAVGNKIQVDDIVGEIEKITSLSIEVKTGNSTIAIPMSRIATGNVTKSE